MERQATIERPASVSGLGLHTGEITTLRFQPADAGTGVIIRRIDLPGKPEFPAHISSVLDTQRSTTLGKLPAIVGTVEHILASLQCLSIDNVIIEADAPETPLMDGSAKQFVEALLSAGRVEQDAEVEYIELRHPVAVDDETITLCAIPSEEYRISYTMSYRHPVLGHQFLSMPITRESFIEEISPCRTFALYSELEQLLKMGLIKGGSLDNAIVVTDNAILSKEGLRFSDEFVRHKIMDMIGDMTLTGKRLKAHVISIRSGHAHNVKLAQAICAASNHNE